MSTMNREEIISILEYGVMAPSTHNTQPWKFSITNDGVEIYLDQTRILTQADPHMRDAFISIGCLIENISIAATAKGYGAQVCIYSPERNKTNAVAAIIFSKKSDSAEKSNRALFDTIPKRVNSRGLFTKEAVPLAKIESEIAIMAQGGYFTMHSIAMVTDQTQLNSIAQLTEEGIAEAHHSDAFREEMSHWMPSALSKRKNGLQWYSLHMPFFLSFFIAEIIKNKDMGHVLAKKSADCVRSAQVGLAFTANEENLATWMTVGRSAEHLMLYIQSLGFHTSIYVGGTEIGDRAKDFAQLLGGECKPQFFFVVGKISTPHKVSPRESVISKLLN